MHSDVDVEAVADELYGLPVEEFTAARDGHAASARRDGDRELADAIKKLGRPTTAAWLANLLVRQRSQQIAELLELGAAMREAQAELAAEQMRALATQRRQIVSALGREAASLANDRGHRVSRAIREEMEGTLEAALADPGAAEALRSGQLTASLRYTGLGSVDISGAVAAPRRAGASTPKPPKAASRSTSGDGEADRKRRERIEAAEHKLEEARTEAADAQGARDAAERVVRDVQERVDGLRRQLDELEQQMQRLRGEEKFASKNLTEAERAKRTAADASRRAKEYVAKAEASLRSLTGRPEQ
jgi:chromosome segregation ATPase